MIDVRGLDRSLSFLRASQPSIVDINIQGRTVTVEGGIMLTKVNHALAAVGLALSNLGSISDQTVGGMLAAGTHGPTPPPSASSDPPKAQASNLASLPRPLSASPS